MRSSAAQRLTRETLIGGGDDVGRLIYSMSVSLDGFIAGPDGDIGWGAPDDELHRFHNARVREIGGQILGRRLHEVMGYWDTAEDDPAIGDTEREFARIWQALPKLVFSTTLTSIAGDAHLATGGIAEELAAFRERVDGDIGVGGATLAASFIALDLIDEYEMFVCPVVLGGGTPYFPTGHHLELEHVETRVFGGRVTHIRHRRPRSAE
jgi:dihydrofolate reductase